MRPFHFEFEGKSTRVGYGSAVSLRPVLTPQVKTSSGAVTTQRVYNGQVPSLPQPTAESLISGDPELDLALAGRRLVEELTVAYAEIGSEGISIAESFQLVDEVRDPSGAVKEKRPHKQQRANINLVDPVKIARRLPEQQVLSGFVFRRVLQLVHEDNLAFDFLYSVAASLAEKQEMALLAAGPKANLPLVFTEGGTAYRTFLYGRVKADEYRLMLLLSERELKLPPR